MEARVFGPHVAFGAGEVAEKIAEGEAAGLEGPFDIFWRDAACNAESAGANFFEMGGELAMDFGVFHFFFARSFWRHGNYKCVRVVRGKAR